VPYVRARGRELSQMATGSLGKLCVSPRCFLCTQVIFVSLLYSKTDKPDV